MTTISTKRAFSVQAIEPAVLDELRGRDDAGNAPELVVEGEGGSPLRCCLRTSRPRERLLLVSYAPLRRWARATGADPGPYDEVGPVFIHADPCGGADGGGYPVELRDTDRVFRGYDGRGRIVRGELAVAATDHEALLSALFDDPAIAFVHARALGHGCFTFAVSRGSD